MRCENFLCIYEQKGQCVLKRTELDIAGACKSCVYPDVDKDLLERLKKETLQKMNGT